MKETFRSDSYAVIDRVEGNLMYLVGFDYPHKGIPHIPGVLVANRLKRNVFLWWKVPALPGIPTAFAKEFHKLSPALAYIFEYDQAYRFRLQNLFTETTKEKLLSHPMKEVLRLLRINKERDYPEVHRKFVFYFGLLIVLLLFPPIRASILRRIQTLDYSQLLPDDNDLYWMGLKVDYRYFSKKNA